MTNLVSFPASSMYLPYKGYHRYLRRLLSSYCASPALAHSFFSSSTTVGTLGWLLRTAAYQGRLGSSSTNSRLRSFNVRPLAGTQTTPFFLNGSLRLTQQTLVNRAAFLRAHGDVSSEPSDLVGEQGLTQNAVPMPKLTHSAKKYAQMMHTGMPVTPVHTGAENGNLRAS